MKRHLVILLLILPHFAPLFAQIPFVDAGSSRSVWTAHPSVALEGHIQGFTTDPAFTWTKTLGDGSVTFSDPHGLKTQATFSAPGTYELQLDAHDSAGDHVDKLTVQVYDPTQTLKVGSWGTPGQPIKQDFGYTDAELQKNFTGDLGIQYELTGLDYDRLKAAPAPFVHPRILMNPEDKPDMLNRLKNTETGKHLIASINLEVQGQLLGDKAPLAPVYAELLAGKPSTLEELMMKVHPEKYGFSEVIAGLTYEIFQAYINDDAAEGKAGVTALTTLAGFSLDRMKKHPEYEWGPCSELVGHQALGFAYDYGYGFMTDDQRSIIRQTLAAATANKWIVGMDSLPAYDANRSNWIANNGLYALIDDLAIEGEPGCDPYIFPKLRAAYERFFMIGVSPDGSLYEGMGKGQLNAEALIALAKRGKFLIAASSAKNHVRNFHLHCMETDGSKFTWEELLGSNHDDSKYADVPTLRYAFPNDPVMDLIYRVDMSSYSRKTGVYKDLDRNEGLNAVNYRFIYQTYDVLVRSVLACDCDMSKPLDQELASLNGKEPLSAFFEDRGLLVTRSSWDTSGLRLMFQPRSLPGGHSVPDRNFILISALGRVWLAYNGYGDHATDGTLSNIIRIDDHSPTSFAAKVVEYKDTPLFTYAVGDARNAYSMKFVGNPKKIPPTAVIESDTVNDSRLTPRPEAWANMPWGNLPMWYTSEKTNSYWMPVAPVQRAFRTAGLVRGKHPYVLVVDDIQQDTQPHAYDWRALLDDLDGGVTAKIDKNDAILSDPTGQRHLLIRLLAANGTAAITAPVETWLNPFKRPVNATVLDIKTTAVSPDFKVLIYPFTEGTPLPETTGNASSMTIKTSDQQTDQVNFQPSSNGLTKVSFTRIHEAVQP